MFRRRPVLRGGRYIIGMSFGVKFYIDIEEFCLLETYWFAVF